MKTLTFSLRSAGLSLLLGVASLSAQSCAAVDTFGQASQHAVNASGEVLQSGAASVAGSVQAGSGVVAVPVWMSGQVVRGSGAVVSAVGQSTEKAGKGMANGAEQLWDFASGDPAQRPALDREHAVPPAPSPASAPAATAPTGPAPTSSAAPMDAPATVQPHDPSPAEALKAR